MPSSNNGSDAGSQAAGPGPTAIHIPEDCDAFRANRPPGTSLYHKHMRQMTKSSTSTSREKSRERDGKERSEPDRDRAYGTARKQSASSPNSSISSAILSPSYSRPGTSRTGTSHSENERNLMNQTSSKYEALNGRGGAGQAAGNGNNGQGTSNLSQYANSPPTTRDGGGVITSSNYGMLPPVGGAAGTSQQQQRRNGTAGSDGSRSGGLSLAPSSSSSSSSNGGIFLDDPDLPYRPSFLHRRVLLLFLLSFAMLLIIVEAAFDFSRRYSGLDPDTPTPAAPYLWKMLPTGFLLLLVALWGRVSYQAKAAAPWIRMAEEAHDGGADAERSLLLDYLSMWRVQAVWRAWKNRDLVVCLAGVVEGLLALSVAVAAGMVSLGVSESLAPLDTRGGGVANVVTAFVDDPSGLVAEGGLAYYMMRGMLDSSMAAAGVAYSYPEGVTSEYAYQRFTVPVSVARALPAATQLMVTVDGLKATVDCALATLAFDGASARNPGASTGINNGTVSNTTASATTWSISLESPEGCSLATSFEGPSAASIAGVTGNTTFPFARMGFAGCGAARNASAVPSLDDMRLWVVVGSLTVDPSTIPRGLQPQAPPVPINGTISRSVQLVCKPDYSLSSVVVSRSASALILGGNIESDIVVPDTSEEATAAGNRTLSNVHPWMLAKAHFDSFGNPLAASRAGGTSMPFVPPIGGSVGFVDVSSLAGNGSAGAAATAASVDADLPMTMAIDFARVSAGTGALPPRPGLDDLMKPDALVALVSAYYTQYGAFLSRTGLARSVVAAADSSTPTAAAAATDGSEPQTTLPITAKLLVPRLTIHPFPTHLLAGLLSLCLLLTIAVFLLVPTKGFLPRDPGTIIGIAAIVAHSKPLLQALRGTGAASVEDIADRLRGSRWRTAVESYGGGSPGSGGAGQAGFNEKTGATSSGGRGYFKILGSGETGYGTGNTGVVEYIERSGRWTKPRGLRGFNRMGLLLFPVAGIVVLEVLVRRAGVGAPGGPYGFVDIPGSPNDMYAHMLWTTLPVLFLLLVAGLFLATDYAVRWLAPYARLARAVGRDNDPSLPPARFADSVGLDLLDRSVPGLVVATLRTKNWAGVASGLAVFIAGLVVIFGSAVFAAVAVPLDDALSLGDGLAQAATASGMTVTLRPTDIFAQGGSVGSANDSSSSAAASIGASLVLDAGVPLPAFVNHDGLVFPSLELVDIPGELPQMLAMSRGAGGFGRVVTVSAAVPAVRTTLTCRVVAQDQIRTAISLNTTDALGNRGPLTINFEPCRANNASSNLIVPINGNPVVGIPALAGGVTDPVFGVSASRIVDNGGNNQCSDWIYAWGRLENITPNNTTPRGFTGAPAVSFVSALACNETLDDVFAQTTFRVLVRGTDSMTPRLVIETVDPPLQNTARRSSVVMTPLTYRLMANISSSSSTPSTPAASEGSSVTTGTSVLLDPFFASLVLPSTDPDVTASTSATGSTSRDMLRPLPPNFLAQAAQASAVADALQARHRLFRALAIDATLRRPAMAGSGQGSALANGTTTAVQDIPASLQIVSASTATSGDAQAQTDGSASGAGGESALPPGSTPPNMPIRLRLALDPVPTRVTQGFFAVLAVLHVLAWLMAPTTTNTNNGEDFIHPRPAGMPGSMSIASRAAALADGNVWGYLGRGAEWLGAGSGSSGKKRDPKGKGKAPTAEEEEQAQFMDGVSVARGWRMGWSAVRDRHARRTRGDALSHMAGGGGNATGGGAWGKGFQEGYVGASTGVATVPPGVSQQRAFGISVEKTGGWGGGEAVGLGLQARVGMGQWEYIRGRGAD